MNAERSPHSTLAICCVLGIISLLLGGYYGTVLVVKNLPQQRAYRQYRLKQAGTADLDNGSKLRIEDMWTLEPAAQPEGECILRLLCRWEGNPPTDYDTVLPSLLEVTQSDLSHKLNDAYWALAVSSSASSKKNAPFIWEFALKKEAKLPDHIKLRVSYIKKYAPLPTVPGETPDQYRAREAKVLQSSPCADIVLPNVSVPRGDSLPPDY